MQGAEAYLQPGSLFRLMNAHRKERLFGTSAGAVQEVLKRIIACMLVHFYRAEQDRRVAGRPGMDMEKYVPWTDLSLKKELAEKKAE